VENWKTPPIKRVSFDNFNEKEDENFFFPDIEALIVQMDAEKNDDIEKYPRVKTNNFDKSDDENNSCWEKVILLKRKKKKTKEKEREKTDVFLKAFLRNMKKFLRKQVDHLGLGNDKYKKQNYVERHRKILIKLSEAYDIGPLNSL
jgi:hypothetical protein